MKFQATLATALLATGMIGPAHAATATFITASPYAQFSDSPFAALAAGNPNFFLENFEDGSLNTPGATASAGFAVSGGLFIDSVDGDDGSLDGSGLNGHSWYTGFAPTTLSFSFSAAALGFLPTHVGIVWTDVGLVPNGLPQNVDSVAVRAFDANGNSLGGILFDDLGDGAVNGGTAEDRFFGAIFDGGISRISITSLNDSGDWEVDHLQYGLAPVPVPGAAWMLAPALVGLFGLRRKRA
jgi:hypothetical protein